MSGLFEGYVIEEERVILDVEYESLPPEVQDAIHELASNCGLSDDPSGLEKAICFFEEDMELEEIDEDDEKVAVTLFPFSVNPDQRF